MISTHPQRATLSLSPPPPCPTVLCRPTQRESVTAERKVSVLCRHISNSQDEAWARKKPLKQTSFVFVRRRQHLLFCFLDCDDVIIMVHPLCDLWASRIASSGGAYQLERWFTVASSSLPQPHTHTPSHTNTKHTCTCSSKITKIDQWLLVFFPVGSCVTDTVCLLELHRPIICTILSEYHHYVWRDTKRHKKWLDCKKALRHFKVNSLNCRLTAAAVSHRKLWAPNVADLWWCNPRDWCVRLWPWAALNVLVPTGLTG